MRRPAIAALVLAILCQAPLAKEEIAPGTVSSLFAALAQAKPGRRAFRETKHLALLDKPVESSGELVFTPPARLEKRTTSPKPESVVVDGDAVTIERNGRKQTLSLREHPAIGVLVDSIRATLAGDLNALTRAYSIGLEGGDARWKLTLRPLDPSSATVVEHLEITGAKDEVRGVEIFQADGDRSVMTIAPAR